MAGHRSVGDHGPLPTRRATLQVMTLVGLAGLGLAGPAHADNAPGWPAEAFQKKSQRDALQALLGMQFESTDKITLEVPEIAENGAVVPVSISSSLPNVTSISILVPENPFTLAASYKLPEGTAAAVSCRLKMAKTSNVVAVVESGGKAYGVARQVKVTLGGCGG
ncbi:MAG TPA: thiosulfate oxidation carrier protein SoxY [Acetobacteraceae bacterium]|nr:thiosulfate oxidation carrier protein SoxY [Acetobacteraceae bacterium]